MKFGVREICEVVLRAKSNMTVGSKTFFKNEPVLYFDSLTTSSLEGAATTVYAQGGRGNARLLAWEGERTLTFNMTDALISPESFAVLSGATVLDAKDNTMLVHTTSRVEVKRIATGDVGKADELDGAPYRIFIDLPGWDVVWDHAGEMNADDVPSKAKTAAYAQNGDIFIMKVNGNEMTTPEIPYDKGVYQIAFAKNPSTGVYDVLVNLNSDPAPDLSDVKKFTRIECYAYAPGSTVLVDYYVKQVKGKQIEITPDKFGGYFYLEASTLFRDEDTGKDLPAEFIIPRCKVQSNFTFSMAATGDPSTFDFVLDAFPDYTKFDSTKKVLAVLQVVEDAQADEDGGERPHIEKTDISATTSGDKEHKTRYGAAGQASGYAAVDDTIASSDFKLGTTVTLAGATAADDDALTRDFGKTHGEFQEDIVVNNGVISGTSKYVTDFTEFSGDPAQQQGNYIALHADVTGADTVTVQVRRTTGEKDAVVLDNDRLIILLLTPTTTVRGIEVIGTKNGTVVGKKFYTLNLTYLPNV